MVRRQGMQQTVILVHLPGLDQQCLEVRAQVVMGEAHALGCASSPTGEQEQRQVIVAAGEGLGSRAASSENLGERYGLWREVLSLPHDPPRSPHCRGDLW